VRGRGMRGRARAGYDCGWYEAGTVRGRRGRVGGRGGVGGGGGRAMGLGAGGVVLSLNCEIFSCEAGSAPHLEC
jgi:hypothetical protein